MNYDEVVGDEEGEEKGERDEAGGRWMVLLCYC